MGKGGQGAGGSAGRKMVRIKARRFVLDAFRMRRYSESEPGIGFVACGSKKAEFARRMEYRDALGRRRRMGRVHEMYGNVSDA